MEKFSTLDLSAHFNVTRDNEPPEPGRGQPWLRRFVVTGYIEMS